MSSGTFDMTRDAIEEDVALYRRARAARLTSDKGWLTLVGKFWLAPDPMRKVPGARFACPPIARRSSSAR